MQEQQSHRSSDDERSEVRTAQPADHPANRSGGEEQQGAGCMKMGCLGGCGCLGVILLCVFGFGIWVYGSSDYQNVQDPAAVEEQTRRMMTFDLPGGAEGKQLVKISSMGWTVKFAYLIGKDPARSTTLAVVYLPFEVDMNAQIGREELKNGLLPGYDQKQEVDIEIPEVRETERSMCGKSIRGKSGGAEVSKKGETYRIPFMQGCVARDGGTYCAVVGGRGKDGQATVNKIFQSIECQTGDP